MRHPDRPRVRLWRASRRPGPRGPGGSHVLENERLRIVKFGPSGASLNSVETSKHRVRLTPGRYEVTAETGGPGSQSRKVVVGAGETREVRSSSRSSKAPGDPGCWSSRFAALLRGARSLRSSFGADGGLSLCQLPLAGSRQLRERAVGYRGTSERRMCDGSREELSRCSVMAPAARSQQGGRQGRGGGLLSGAP